MSYGRKIYIIVENNAIIVLGGIMKRKKLKLNIRIIIILLLLTLLLSIFYLNTSNNKIKKSHKNNFCLNIKYCNKKYINRYKSFQKKNPSLSKEEIITQVNLNLDYSFYTHTKKTPLLNKETILVNKYLYLSNDYIPSDLVDIPNEFARSGMKLVKVAKDNFVNMAQAAKTDGSPIIAMSSYRSYEYQVNLYNKYVKSDGVEAADTYSARPGFSEHQTGLCVDIYDGKTDYTNFEKSKSYTWMQENAHKYGFILRFPKGKENITGYQYESWHYRYVGKTIANYIHKTNLTFDEYYVKFIEK